MFPTMSNTPLPAILRPAEYGAAWRRARDAFLREHPTCKACGEYSGRVVAATVVDHVVPHRGNPRLFWDRANWQALCKRCHDSHKQRAEKSGRVLGCSADGTPIDPRHHWHTSQPDAPASPLTRTHAGQAPRDEAREGTGG